MISSSVDAVEGTAPLKGIAAERAKAHAEHFRRLAWLKRQPIVVDHDQRARALHDRTRLGEIERDDRNILGFDVVPDVELGPIRQRKHPHRFAALQPRVVKPPKFRALVARVPGVGGGAMRKDALLGAAFFLVAPCAAECGVIAAFVQSLAQGFCLHHLGVDLAARSDGRNAAPQPVLIDMDDELQA